MKLKLFGLAAISALALSSCVDESPWAGSDSNGGINLRFSADHRVMRQSRADDADLLCPVTPEADQFSVSLTSNDGAYSSQWGSVEAFNREGSFPVGDYVITASYGDPNVEGFDIPYYKGQTSVRVSPSEEAQASITATLAQAMVSIRYSEEFETNFPTHSAAVQTAGHDWLHFPQTETRPAFIAPSDDVKLNLTLTNAEGKQVTIQPAGFQAVPRHHYIVNIGVDGSTGNLVLKVEFEENVVNETVEVSLGDDLFTAPAPTITTDGFTPGQTISGFEHLTVFPSVKYNVFAYGGIREANLNIVSDSYNPAFGKSAQLANASTSLQSQLEQEGISCVGFFKKVDKMGLVDVSEFLNKLPAGKHSVELQVVDAMTRVSDPVKLNIDLQKVNFEFGPASTVLFGATEVTVDINTNCPEIKDKFTFRAPDSNNRMVEVTAKKVEEVTPALGKLGYTYRYVLQVATQKGSEVDVEAKFGETTIYTTLPVVLPDYKIEADGFARHVVLRISDDNGNAQAIIDRLTFANNGTDIPAQNISYDTDNNYVIIRGLNPGATYNNMVAKFGKEEKAVPSFTTESEAALTNGDFSKSLPTINISDVSAGGAFEISVLGVHSRTQPKITLTRSTPEGWADLNQLTCFPGSQNLNSWYVVPSTWSENDAVVIQSVGYHHNGEEIPLDKKGSSTDYYSRNTPSNLIPSTGELFLGSYTFGTAASERTDGMPWTTRPSTLSFDYMYAPQADGELGEAYIQILAADGSVLSTQSVDIPKAEEMTRLTVTLSGYPFNRKAASIQLGFRSTKKGQTPELFIPTGSQLKEDEITTSNYRGTGWSAFNQDKINPLQINSTVAYARGSKLTVDNVVLGYDPKGAAPQNKARKSNKRR